tara:strand:- start:534 stop:971 length:438 start_codon:yes stop_codon:yes gene_type:complete
MVVFNDSNIIDLTAVLKEKKLGAIINFWYICDNCNNYWREPSLFHSKPEADYFEDHNKYFPFCERTSKREISFDDVVRMSQDCSDGVCVCLLDPAFDDNSDCGCGCEVYEGGGTDCDYETRNSRHHPFFCTGIHEGDYEEDYEES